MTRALFDINVVLDVLLDRQPHVTDSARAWALAESRRVEGLLAAHAFTTIHYLACRQSGSRRQHTLITELMSVFAVAGVDATVLKAALSLSTPDFEDAVTASAAHVARCSLIVTRDPAGFRDSPVPAVTPRQFLSKVL